jgi:hypothetical protein
MPIRALVPSALLTISKANIGGWGHSEHAAGITCAATASNLFASRCPHRLRQPHRLESIFRDFGRVILLGGTHPGIEHVGSAKRPLERRPGLGNFGNYPAFPMPQTLPGE